MINYDTWIYLWIAIKYCLAILIVLWLYYGISLYIKNSRIDITAGFLWLLIYIAMIFELLNKYLDTIVITPYWVSVFNRNGLTEYKMETFDRPKIETVSHEQDSLVSSLLNRGHIAISLDPGIHYKFGYINNPKLHSDILLHTKHRQYQPDENESTPPDTDKFNILVETLGEVIIDYIKKDNQ